jgi:hypothetical protein
MHSRCLDPLIIIKVRKVRGGTVRAKARNGLVTKLATRALNGRHCVARTAIAINLVVDLHRPCLTETSQLLPEKSLRERIHLHRHIMTSVIMKDVFLGWVLNLGRIPFALPL